jgi:hypothetical protein
LNPYAPPEAAVQPAGTAPGDAPTRHELEMFAVKNGDYYWERAARREHRYPLLSGWNLAAAFLSLIWLLYRRMWREFWIAIAITVALGVVEAVLGEMVGAQAERFVERVSNFAYFFVMGAIGNGLYLRRARREVWESRRLCGTDLEKQRAHLGRRGGTSWIAAVIGAVTVGGLTVVGIISSLSG